MEPRPQSLGGPLEPRRPAGTDRCGGRCPGKPEPPRRIDHSRHSRALPASPRPAPKSRSRSPHPAGKRNAALLAGQDEKLQTKPGAGMAYGKGAGMPNSQQPLSRAGPAGMPGGTDGGLRGQTQIHGSTWQEYDRFFRSGCNSPLAFLALIKRTIDYHSRVRQWIQDLFLRLDDVGQGQPPVRAIDSSGGSGSRIQHVFRKHVIEEAILSWQKSRLFYHHNVVLIHLLGVWIKHQDFISAT